MIRYLILTVLTLFALPAHAAEPFTYSPDYCEFTATFPEEPYTREYCDPGQPSRCTEKKSYTQVFDYQTTVNFRIKCSQISEATAAQYNEEVMKGTLSAMTQHSLVQAYEMSFREEDGYKQAGLVGEGRVGRTSAVMIAQVWIGKQSAMTVEAELIGPAHEDADVLFRDILRSIFYKVEKEPEESNEPEDSTPQPETESAAP